MKITVIGAGPGGYETAFYAAKKGAEVVLIEKDKLGGTCLNRGCIPTKAFLASYDTLEAVKNAKEYGIQVSGDVAVDYPAVVARKNKVMDILIKGIATTAKKLGVTVMEGTGSLVDKNTVKVTKADGSEELVTTDYIVLATGSVPVAPPVFKVDRKRVVTSDEILDFQEAPESLILVGGGVIGCEIGQFLAGMGTKVTVVEALPRILAPMDEDVSKQLAKQFKREKIKVITGDGISEVNPSEDHVDVTLASGKTLSAAYVLVAIGRAPNLKGLNLEAAGVEMAERGRVAVDATMKTNVDNIYAIGDIVPTAMLAHVATKEGFVAIDNIMGTHKEMKYHAVPGCVFTTPEIANVGTMEWQLQKEGKAAGTDYKTGSFELRALGKAQASGHLAGFVKVIVDANDVLIGAEIVGDRAADMLQVLTTAISLGLTAEQVADSIFPHPTMCEGIMEALHNIH